MAKVNCSKDSYSKDGRCCDRCPAGTYAQAECDGEKPTVCAKCPDGFYTATKNHLNKCQVCRECSSHNNQRKAKECSATENTVCECKSGLYCSNDQCDHCQPVTPCSVGVGVKNPANRTSDTKCAPCEEGTYSNVTDFLSPCKPHTRCEVLGRTLKVHGTKTTNAVCGDFLPRCSWILPASLWSGLVLTALFLFVVVICWRAKRKSYRAASPNAPVTLVEMVPTTDVTSLDLHLPSTELNGHCQELNGHCQELNGHCQELNGHCQELNGHCQESCAMDECKIRLFTTDDDLVNCSKDSSLPITPLKASVSFVESKHNNGSVRYHTANFLRTYSEPQEDEWCGT
ncbi:tumor necrosis factor receptor superfamily member 5 isoform X2 [Toxotes jaculatrix]|uniref:tumor necrosis factor receptor superfamily member 5 isoform X2 n=1 Tax=Toxotes jaculatrix TaxID=941984 RepID=UPI001B3B0EF0|nr:tumor necrosis factor receptor superfamily member 5 isoform X2 [Toxotes jaculatrix]